MVKKTMQNIINTIDKSIDPEEVKQLLKSLPKLDLVKVAKCLDIHIRGNENKTEIVNNIVLGTAEAKYRSLGIRRMLE